MEVLYLSKENMVKVLKSTVYTIGNFDGVHNGHKKLLEATKVIAKNLQVNWAVITFANNTKNFFNNNHKILQTLEQKLKCFAKLNIPKVIIIDFNNIYMLSSQQFITNYLVDYLNAKALVVGSNFKMGKDLFIINNQQKVFLNSKKNDFKSTNDLKLISSYNISGLWFKEIPISEFIYSNNVLKMPMYSVNIENSNNAEYISSTKIKDLISEGNVKKANKMLGHNFSIVSKVIHGNKIGRTIGYPTINMLVPKYVTLKHGIYATKTILPNNEVKKSISSFGIRPTIKNSNKQEVLETFIFDYNDDLYDKEVTVEFIDYIREEKKFSGLDELVQNIKIDVSKAKKILNTHKE